MRTATTTASQHPSKQVRLGQQYKKGTCAVNGQPYSFKDIIEKASKTAMNKDVNREIWKEGAFAHVRRKATLDRKRTVGTESKAEGDDPDWVEEEPLPPPRPEEIDEEKKVATRGMAKAKNPAAMDESSAMSSTPLAGLRLTSTAGGATPKPPDVPPPPPTDHPDRCPGTC